MKRHRLALGCLFVSAWLLVLLLFAWLVLRYVPGDSLLPIRLISYVTPWLALLALLLSLFALMFHHRLLALLLFISGLIVFAPYFSSFIPHDPSLSTGPSLKVMTYSVMGRNNDYEAMAQVFSEHQPDLAFFQEVGLEALKGKLTERAGAETLYFQPTNVGFIASRYPLSLDEPSRPYTRVKMTWPAGTVTLWNVHADKALRNYRQFDQVDALMREVKTINGPRIVAGDFNSTQQAEIYRMVRKTLVNAHEDAGWGFGFTFPTPARRIGFLIPFLRIDHIFYSDDFVARQCDVGENAGGSDHLPVIANLTLK